MALIAGAFPAELRTTGVALTAGLAIAFIGGTAPAIDQLLVANAGIDAGLGVYLAAVALLAALAVWRWDERPIRR